MSTTSSIANTLNSQASTSTKTTTPASKSLTANDFINMMVTQLQNQDPTDPTKSSDLLAQMSQIGSLQASTDLQTSLKTLVLQNNLASAGSLIGKTVTGKDDVGADLGGVVSSVKVVDGALSLNLDNGSTLSMSNVLTVAPTVAASTSTTGKAA